MIKQKKIACKIKSSVHDLTDSGTDNMAKIGLCNKCVLKYLEEQT